MAQFYSLDEAARVLGMSPEELKSKAQQREVRAFMDSGSWQFRVADIDELARRRGLGSDPELSLSDLDLSIPSMGTGSEEINLTEFQLGVAKPDLAPPSGEVPAGPEDSAEFDAPSPDGGSDHEILLDDLSVPPGPLGGSSSTIIGMDQPGKSPSDSDVRLVPDSYVAGPSDSDVRLSPMDKAPSDSDVTLVNDEGSDPGLGDLPGGPGDTSVRQSPLVGSSAEVPAAPGEDSDFELTPSSVIDALQPESGSDFELTALDESDEFEATPLGRGPSDSDVTAADPSTSGINLGRPSDSGINLGGVGTLDLGAESIELTPLSGDEIPTSKAPAPRPAAPTPPPARAEKDIFEESDFEVDALGSDEEGDDKTMQIEATSDFDLEDSGSDVFAIDEDDVDQNAATAMAPAVLEDDEDDDGFSAIAEEVSAAEGGSGWDVESEGPAPAAAASPMMSRDAGAEWSGIWVGVLSVASVLTLLMAFVSMDLVRNLYDVSNDLPTSGIVKGIASMIGG